MTDHANKEDPANSPETMRRLAAAYLDLWETIASEHALRGPQSSPHAPNNRTGRNQHG
ncbi:MAG: hypothetical protein ACPGFA_08680 [Pikeienuella sp.]